MNKAGLLAGLALAMAVGPAWSAPAQEGPRLVQSGQDLYQQARFQEAQDDLRRAIARMDLSPPQRAQAWTYLGLSFLGLGQRDMALQAMASARAAYPAYAPDQDQLSPKARELWLASDPNRPAPAPSPQPAGPAAAPSPSPAPPPTLLIRETPLAEPAPRLYGLELAYDVRQGRPVGITQVFAPQTKRIHLWVGLDNVPEGTPLRALWTYLDDPPVRITDSEFLAPAGAAWVEFSCQLAPGQTWPAGRYQVEAFLDQESAGSLEFEVP